MQYAHNIQIKVFCKEEQGENCEEIKNKLLTFIPYTEEEIEKKASGTEKIKIDSSDKCEISSCFTKKEIKPSKGILLEEETLELNNNREMKSFTIKLIKQKHINKTLKYLMELIGSEQKKYLIETLDTRIDEKMNLYFRIDKAHLNSSEECKFTDSGDCYHFKINIAAYPAKIETAKKIVEEMLS